MSLWKIILNMFTWSYRIGKSQLCDTSYAGLPVLDSLRRFNPRDSELVELSLWYRPNFSPPAQLLMLCGEEDTVHQPACLLSNWWAAAEIHTQTKHTQTHTLILLLLLTKVHLKLVLLSQWIRGHRDKESCTFHPFLFIFFKLSTPQNRHGDT